MKAKVLAVVRYCTLHKKQLSAAIAFGAALLEAIQKAH
jgi:hypothetical protein